MELEPGHAVEHRLRRDENGYTGAGVRLHPARGSGRDENRLDGIAAVRDEALNDEPPFGDEETALQQPARIADVTIRLEPRIVLAIDDDQVNRRRGGAIGGSGGCR